MIRAPISCVRLVLTRGTLAGSLVGRKVEYCQLWFISTKRVVAHF